MSSYELVVTQPFTDPSTGRLYRVSDHIRDEGDVARIMRTQPSRVVRIAPTPDPQGKEEKSPAGQDVADGGDSAKPGARAEKDPTQKDPAQKAGS